MCDLFCDSSTDKCEPICSKTPKIQGIVCANFKAGGAAEMKPLSVGKAWYNKDVEICGCSWSMVKSQEPRAKYSKRHK